jgi:GNAT superfamily N-acetyltransferase
LLTLLAARERNSRNTGKPLGFLHINAIIATTTWLGLFLLPFLLIVYYLDKIIGAATCAPLKWQAAEILAPFVVRGEDLSEYFYFGESVLNAGYRGRGCGVRFFELREDHARACGGRIAVFCSVMRATNHVSRPSNYEPLDTFWTHRGYKPVEGLICELSWKEIEYFEESTKPMQFWAKRLTP